VSHSHVAIVLAGALYPSPLQRQLGRLPACLPIGRRGTLLDAWLEALRRHEACTQIRVVVNAAADASALEAMVAPVAAGPPVTVLTEPSAWRGSAGLLADLSRDTRNDETVVAVEAHCWPPPESTGPLLAALRGEGAAAAVAAGRSGEPAGLYAFSRPALGVVPPVGFHDLKEQMLPALCAGGFEVRLVALHHDMLRVRDRSAYLEAVARSLCDGRADGETPRGAESAPGAVQARVAADARLASGSRLAGCCVLEAGVVLEEGAVVHESVLLEGAIVGRRSLVSRSVVGPNVRIPPSARVVDCIMGAGSARAPRPGGPALAG
jgi:hypothetical protein